MKSLLNGDSKQRMLCKLSYSIRIAAIYLAAAARTATPLATAMGSLAIAHTVRADALRDPTRPPNAQSAFVAPDSQPIRVEAILSSRERMVAIVNGKVVRAGDRIGNARIDEVMNDGIRYTRAGHSEIARLATHLVQVRQPSAPAKDES